MSIVQYGSLNTTAQIVPSLTVQIVPPQVANLNGVASNIIGVVGSAQWGAVNQPVTVGNMASYTALFGNLQNRKYDLGTAVAVAVQQGANSFECVRVTDGTDVAATATVKDTSGTVTGVTLTARYTGSLGNSIQFSITNGSKASTYKAVVAIPGVSAETFDNLPNGTGFWAALVAAINTGAGVRAASNLVVATVGSSTAAPSLTATTTLTGGTDGASSVTSATLVGSSATNTGMYALTNQGCSFCVLADCDDYTQWSTMGQFGLAQAMDMIVALPAGVSVANAVTDKQTASVDTYAMDVLMGDWVYWNDPVNQITRLVSPVGFAAGLAANLTPAQSSLNKPIYGIVGSQKVGAPNTGVSAAYNNADLQTLLAAGIDVITNPAPGGNYWARRGGINSSSNSATNHDVYTKMTNYIAATLQAGMGVYIGQNINSQTFNAVTSTLDNFLTNLVNQGLLARTSSGKMPFSVVCNASDNPLSQTSLGYLVVNVQVQYMGVVRYFVVNLIGGESVQVSVQNG